MRPLAIVATHPIQYQAPFFRYLAATGLPLRVLYLSRQGVDPVEDVHFAQPVQWDVPMLDGYEHCFLRGVSQPISGRSTDLVHPQLLWHLSGKRYSAVLVHGWRYLSMMAAVAGAKSSRLPVLYRSETTPATGSSGIKRKALGLALRASGSICLSIGSLNDAFYASIGVPSARRVLAPYVVDNDRFLVARETSVQQAREAWGLQSARRVVLFSGKLVNWKRPMELLDAFAAASRSGDVLVFAGSGDLQNELKRRAHHLRVDARFLGFVNQSEMPLVYRSADLLVLPSADEPWGLAVNEAMATGVPALVSREVGCGPDLVQGTSGWIVDMHERAALEFELTRLLGEDRSELDRAALAASDRIDDWGYAQYAAGVRDALSRVGCL